MLQLSYTALKLIVKSHDTEHKIFQSYLQSLSPKRDWIERAFIMEANYKVKTISKAYSAYTKRQFELGP